MARSAARAERLLTIGQVVKLLQAEFPDLSITKVRYLEDRGLLSPTRTKGRYRKYDPADVRRLRMILTLQRDEYLPLEVIRQRVDRSTAASPGAFGRGSSGHRPLRRGLEARGARHTASLSYAMPSASSRPSSTRWSSTG